jgi:hypothetical protein
MIVGAFIPNNPPWNPNCFSLITLHQRKTKSKHKKKLSFVFSPSIVSKLSFYSEHRLHSNPCILPKTMQHNSNTTPNLPTSRTRRQNLCWVLSKATITITMLHPITYKKQNSNKMQSKQTKRLLPHWYQLLKVCHLSGFWQLSIHDQLHPIRVSSTTLISGQNNTFKCFTYFQLSFRETNFDLQWQKLLGDEFWSSMAAGEIGFLQPVGGSCLQDTPKLLPRLNLRQEPVQTTDLLYIRMRRKKKLLLPD